MSKPNFALIPWDALWSVAEALTEGANRPDRDAKDWLTVENPKEVFVAKIGRHLAAYACGHEFVEDTQNIRSLAAVAADALILLALELRGKVERE